MDKNDEFDQSPIIGGGIKDHALKIKTARMMAYANVLDWIAKRTAEMIIQIENLSPFEKANQAYEKLSNKCEILKELRHYILMKINPHNRGDIEKANEKDA